MNVAAHMTSTAVMLCLW